MRGMHPGLTLDQCLPLLVPVSSGGLEPPLCFMITREHIFAGLLKIVTITKHKAPKKPFFEAEGYHIPTPKG